MAKSVKMKKWQYTAWAVLLMALLLTGCTSSGRSNIPESTTDGENRETEERSISGSGAAADIESSPEQESGKPERIVSGYYITTSACIALGLEENLVGIEAKASNRPIYGLAAPELLELPNVGTAKEFDLEGCIALEPDLVILPKKLSDQADILENMGIDVLVVNPESMEELEKTINDIASRTGTTERADRLTEWRRAKEEKLSGIIEGEKPSVYISGSSSVLRTASPLMYQNSLIQLAGGENAAYDLKDNGWSNISYEQLIAYNPDVIVIIAEAEYSKEDVQNDERLADVNAVKNGRVYEMPSSYEAWDSPVPSGILGSMWLASVLHGQAYPFEEFQEEAAEFYREFYGVEIDKELITR